MKREATNFFVFFLVVFFATQVNAITTNAVKDGNWSDPNSWDNGVPGIADIAIIDGYIISINSSTTFNGTASVHANEVIVRNTNATINSISRLDISGGGLNLVVGGDVTVQANLIGKAAEIKIQNSSSVLQVNGDVILDAVAAGLASVNVIGGATLGLTGAIIRLNNYGSLIMEDISILILNGIGAQVMPTENVLGSGADSFQLGHIVIDNTVGITLSEPLTVHGDLELTNGKIFSSDANPVIIGDFGAITGGSAQAYIIGTVVKNGRTNGESFTFPLGNATTYAPMVISKVSNSSSAYTARFRGDPPPFGVFQSGVSGVDPTQYWELERAAGSDDVTIDLAWNDGAASGLDNLSNTIVVGLNYTPLNPSADSTWVSYGQGKVTGGVGAGQSGTVASLEGDPPPFGVFQFAVGTGDPMGSLPVELMKFKAKKESGKTLLEWKTGSELNGAQYEIQRSPDGENFELIGITKINGDSEIEKDYEFRDIAPASGTNYYRLKIVDLDGSFEYSNVEITTFGNESVMLIAPNPVDDVMTINTGDTDYNNETTLEVYDRAGMQVYKGTATFQDGKCQFDTASINIHLPGTYFIRISGERTSKVVKFLKIN